MEINSNILAIGATEGEGIILLITQDKIEDSEAKCVTVDRSVNEIGLIDKVAKATTFNAFEQLNSDKGEIVKAAIERELTDEQIFNINTYLQDERQI